MYENSSKEDLIKELEELEDNKDKISDICDECLVKLMERSSELFHFRNKEAKYLKKIETYKEQYAYLKKLYEKSISEVKQLRKEMVVVSKERDQYLSDCCSFASELPELEDQLNEEIAKHINTMCELYKLKEQYEGEKQ